MEWDISNITLEELLYKKWMVMYEKLEQLDVPIATEPVKKGSSIEGTLILQQNKGHLRRDVSCACLRWDFGIKQDFRTEVSRLGIVTKTKKFTTVALV